MINKLRRIIRVQTNIKAFLISFIAVFAMVAIPKLGFKLGPIQSSTLVSPQKPSNIFDDVLRKLHLKTLNFKLHESPSFIQKSYAQAPYDGLSAYSVVDLSSGQIIEQKNLKQPLPIASLTKIMTAVVALDLASPNESFIISENSALIEPTKIGVVPGQKMTLNELLDAAMLTSANDAVEAIKDGIDRKYGEEVFIKAMNEKAKFLGLENTHFTNPQGFDNTNHFSSVYDLGILSQYALTQYPLISEIVKKDYQFLAANSDHKQFDLYNWNGLLGVYPHTEGLKIGNTDDAGKTTIVVSRRQNKPILVVSLGAPGVLERDLWTAQLLDLGYDKTLSLSPINVSEDQLKAKYQTWKYWQ